MRRSIRKRLKYKKRTRKRKQRGGSQEPLMSFISYGNDDFKDSRERIRNEATKMGCFNGQIKVYTPDDLSQEFKAAVGDVINEKRGGGYWIWKPYIIADMLSKLNDGDILVYADSGCTLQPAGVPRLKEYAKMISPDSGKSVLLMRLRDHVAKRWTTTEIMNYFGLKMDDPIITSKQILAGVIVCRKCSESQNVIGKWLEIAKTRPDLFTDKHHEASKETNEDFEWNRHDQAVLSPIAQMQPFMTTCLVIDEEIERTSNPIRPDEYFVDKPIIASRIRK